MSHARGVDAFLQVGFLYRHDVITILSLTFSNVHFAFNIIFFFLFLLFVHDLRGLNERVERHASQRKDRIARFVKTVERIESSNTPNALVSGAVRVQQIMQTRLLADPVNEDLQLRVRGKANGEGMPLYANQKAALKADRIGGQEFRDRFADMNAGGWPGLPLPLLPLPLPDR